eukprot:Nitzschia sp. Nitz4//scaffold36_size144017//56083//57762//NITZ4_003087-RA/size144017-processed-gene-0.42-mRNA-1//1//CDS//3329549459//2212//frame0
MNKGQLLLLGLLVGACEAWLVPVPLLHSRLLSQSHTPRSVQQLKSTPNSDSFPPWDEENDPYRILGIDGTTADPQFILNTFRRLTHKYHPDVITSRHSTPEEKRAAQQHFEKICRAFEAIYSGKVPPRPVTRATDTPVRRVDPPKQTPPTAPSGFPPPSQESTWPLGPPDTTSNKRPRKNIHFYSPDGSLGDIESLGKFFEEVFGGGQPEMEGGFGDAGGAGGSGDPGLDLFQNMFQQLLGGAFAPPQPSHQRGARPVRKPVVDETIPQRPTHPANQPAPEMQAIEHSVESLRSRLKTIRHNMDQWNSDMQTASNFAEKLQLEALQAEAAARTKILTHYIQQGEQRLLELQNKQQNHHHQSSHQPNQSTPDDIATPPFSNLSSNSPSPVVAPQEEQQHDSPDSDSSVQPGWAQSRQETPELSNADSSDDDWIHEGFGRRHRRGTTAAPSEENQSASSTPSVESSNQASDDVADDSEDDDWIHQGFGRRNQRGASRRRPQGRSIPISGGKSRREIAPPQNHAAPHRQTHDDFKHQRQREEKARQDQVEDELRKLKELLGF